MLSIGKLAVCSCAWLLQPGHGAPHGGAPPGERGQQQPQAFLPLWNSQWNASSINHHKVGRAAPCPPSDDLHLAAFGIGSNTPPLADPGNGGYNGGTVATLHYDFGMTGLVPYYTAGPVAHNGGIPQLMNMSAHLSQWQADIDRQFPDPGFAGVVALDWEA